jgi:hypothetical protein
LPTAPTRFFFYVLIYHTYIKNSLKIFEIILNICYSYHHCQIEQEEAAMPTDWDKMKKYRTLGDNKAPGNRDFKN